MRKVSRLFAASAFLAVTAGCSSLPFPGVSQPATIGGLQVNLDRLRCPPGLLDGKWGGKTNGALQDFLRANPKVKKGLGNSVITSKTPPSEANLAYLVEVTNPSVLPHQLSGQKLNPCR